jgi:hypothetical protein
MGTDTLRVVVGVESYRIFGLWFGMARSVAS